VTHVAANVLNAAELKRRGFAAIEERLQRGPVRLLKHSKPAAVVLSESSYARLTGRGGAAAPGMTALRWLLEHRPREGMTKAQIDKRLKGERDAWK
jgi:hypothetical protein